MDEETTKKLLAELEKLRDEVAELRARVLEDEREAQAAAEEEPADFGGGGEPSWDGAMGRVPDGMVENPSVPPAMDANGPETIPVQGRNEPMYKSLEVVEDTPPPGVAQIYGFRSTPTEPKITFKLSSSSSSPTSATKEVQIALGCEWSGLGDYDMELGVPVRILNGDGTREIRWMTFDASGWVAFRIPESTSYEDIRRWYDDCQDTEEEREEDSGADDSWIVVPGPNGGWRIVDLSGYFWRLGGDETSCYGSAAGDSNKAKAIDLDARTLVGASGGGGWSADGDFTAQGDLNAQNTVHADAVDATTSVQCGGAITASGDITTSANMGCLGQLNCVTINVNGDTYAPQTVNIGGQNYTILVKQ